MTRATPQRPMPVATNPRGGITTASSVTTWLARVVRSRTVGDEAPRRRTRRPQHDLSSIVVSGESRRHEDSDHRTGISGPGAVFALSRRIEVLLFEADYAVTRGYSKVASIEMFEAIGLAQYGRIARVSRHAPGPLSYETYRRALSPSFARSTAWRCADRRTSLSRAARRCRETRLDRSGPVRARRGDPRLAPLSRQGGAVAHAACCAAWLGKRRGDPACTAAESDRRRDRAPLGRARGRRGRRDLPRGRRRPGGAVAPRRGSDGARRRGAAAAGAAARHAQGAEPPTRRR